MNTIDNNLSFQAKLDVSAMKNEKKRWNDIAKLYTAQTKGINYESKLFIIGDRLEICVNKAERSNQKDNPISAFTTRVAKLSYIGTKDLLSKKDEVIAKALSEHVKFVKHLDDNSQKVEKVLDKVTSYVNNILGKNGYDPNLSNKMLDKFSVSKVVSSKMSSETEALRKLPGFNDAEISHIG